MKILAFLPAALALLLGCGGGGGGGTPTPPVPVAGSGPAEGTWTGTIQPSGTGQASMAVEGIALKGGELRILAASNMDWPYLYNFTATVSLSYTGSAIAGQGYLYGVSTTTTTGGNLPVQITGTVAGDSFTGTFTGGASGTFALTRTQDYNATVNSNYFLGNTYINDKHTSTGSLINLTVNPDGSFSNCPTSDLGMISGQITQTSAGKNQFSVTLNSPIAGNGTGVGYYVYSGGNIKWFAVLCGSSTWQFVVHVAK